MRMKKSKIRIFVVSVLLTTFLFQSYSQITVTKIEQRNVTSSNEGFIYTLPQTVFKIDVVYEKIQELKGPLMQYTKEYLGATDYISSDNTEYKFVDINVSVFQESDPGQLYFVQYPIERAKDEKKTSFILSKIGGILAYNAQPPISSTTPDIITDQTFIFEEGDEKFPYMSQYNKQKKTDTIIRVINIDTVTINRFLFKSSWIDKSNKDKAADAAMQIEKIRESRYNLISGYQEVNYGTSMVYMDKQMQKMEDQYLELFLGRTVKTTSKQTVFYVPVKNKKQSELMKFDDGTSLAIEFDLGTNSDKLSDVTSSSLNSIYYRIPASVNVLIDSGGINLYNGRFLVNQLGVVSTAPLNNTELQFDSKTGNMISISRE